MRHRFLAHVLLALLLVFAQQVGAVHAAAHAPGHAASHSHCKGTPVKACDECLAFATVEPALAVAAFVPLCVDAVAVLHPDRGGVVAVVHRPAFRSRAPPANP